MANWMFDRGMERIAKAGIDLSTADIRARLVKDTSNVVGTESTARDLDFLGDCTNRETGNIEVDWTMGNVTIARTGSSPKKITWDNSDDITFASVLATQTISAMVVFLWVTAVGDSPLICQISNAAFPIIATGNDIKIVFSANGIVTWQL